MPGVDGDTCGEGDWSPHRPCQWPFARNVCTGPRVSVQSRITHLVWGGLVLGWEAVVLKLAGTALRAASSAAIRAVTTPNHGALAAKNPAGNRLINKVRPARDVQEKDVRHFSQFVKVTLQPLIESEFYGIPENEILAAIEAANKSFQSTHVDLFECSLDPATYADEVIKEARNQVASERLSEKAEQLYQRIVFECSVQVIQFVSTWPSFLAIVNKEQLARLNQLLTETDRVRWAVSGEVDSAAAKFEARYKRYVVQRLDQLELFGLTLAHPESRTYPLSTAYISLALADASSANHPESSLQGSISFKSEGDASRGENSVTSTAGSVRSEVAIASFDRVLLRGDAGSGKSTLLFWLAVNSARGTLDNELHVINNYVPFILPLRRFADRDLPSPHEFLSEVGKNLSGEMPSGWANGVLRTGRALVLIDGVDELPEGKREEAKNWLQDLITAYPHCRYIVTSRPAAAEEQWLAKESFVSLDLLPMGKGDIESFIRHWHDAARETLGSESEESDHADLDSYESELITQVNTQRQLRRLAANPLLCALLCTLNRDRRMQLPRGRMELYAAALEMLLVRRDNERKIVHPDAPNLTLHQKKHILGTIAYWLLRNGLTDCTEEQAVEQIRYSLLGMPSINNDAISVYKYLMVRSGVLRMPVEGRVDFVHRTFQEYLAAESLIALNDIGVLIDHAHLDQWHEAVTMAVGHARLSERREILSRLLSRGNSEPKYTTRLHLLAAASLENADELDPETYREVRQSAEYLIPPTKFSEAKELAAAGETVLALLPRSNRRLRVNQAASTVRAAALIGGDAALEVISSYGPDSRMAVQKELARSWNQFDAREYAVRVLSKSPAFQRSLELDNSEVIDVIEHFNQLVHLYLRFPTGDLSWVSKLPNLRNLVVWHYLGEFSDGEIAGLARVSSLNLGFHEDQNMELCLAKLHRLDSLQYLTVQGRWRDARPRMSLLPPLPNLKDMALLRCNEQPVDADPSRFPSLMELTLHSSGLLDLKGISKFKSLKALTLNLFGSVENADELEALESLEFLSVILVRNTPLEDLAAGARQIKFLRIIAYSNNRNNISVDLSCFHSHVGLKINVTTYGDVDVRTEGLSSETRVHVSRRRW
ncbi:NACHT domain-containing protein [Streptomyces sp. NPDC101152]|uniref:NACHT domain-containing protein n=1 Tax=Streptomyces sp. NPDC101152 TaxID=3366116 RepID=UPI00382C560D